MAVIIGITTSYEQAQQRLDYNYVRAVAAAGAIPVIVPLLPERAAADALAARLDGLIIPGGPAIVQGLIGDIPQELARTDPLRVRSDRTMLDACLRLQRPLLGICYGMQLINAVMGGTIFGDVERQVTSAIAHSDKRGASEHSIRIHANSHLARILGPDRRMVNTYHLQAVAEPGRGLMASAWAPDGVIEAIESDNGAILGVQFHPERMGAEAQPLFEDLVRRAAAPLDTADTRGHRC